MKYILIALLALLFVLPAMSQYSGSMWEGYIYSTSWQVVYVGPQRPHVVQVTVDSAYSGTGEIWIGRQNNAVLDTANTTLPYAAHLLRYNATTERSWTDENCTATYLWLMMRNADTAYVRVRNW